jgi:MFS family permease
MAQSQEPAGDAPEISETPAEAGHAPTAERDLKRNFIALLTHGMLGQTGFQLLQAPTFLPAYLSQLAGNNSAVGIARAIQSLGMSISPYIGAWMVEHRVYVKRLGIVFGGFMRLQIFFLALTALLLPPKPALVGVWIVIGVWGFASGLQGVTFNFVISKTIPPHRRGRLLGLRNATAGATLLLVSALGGWIVDRMGFPTGYGWTFMLAFVLTSAGLVAFSALREPRSERPQARGRLAARMRSLPQLLRGEPGFTGFLAARLLGTAGRGALPFYVLFVGERHGLSGTRLAGLTIVFTLAQAGGALFWGRLADRRGFRAVFTGALLCWLCGNVMVLANSSLVGAYLVFLLAGAGFSGFALASQNLVLEFGEERDRPMRIAAANASSELVGVFSYLGAGMLADAVPLVAVFWLSSGFQILALQQIRRVRDPRFAADP